LYKTKEPCISRQWFY